MWAWLVVAQCSIRGDGFPPFPQKRRNAGPSTPVAAATFAQDDRDTGLLWVGYFMRGFAALVDFYKLAGVVLCTG
jgi:hypothetical protein